MMLTLLCIFKYSITSALCKSALFLGFLLLFVYSITICFPLNDHRLKARRIKDCDNLREIWKSIEMYKNDCGIFPFALGQLLDAGYIKDSRVLICPTQKTEPPLDSNDIRKGQCGYLYWGNNISDMNPETIIACTKPGLLSMPAIFKKGFLNVPWNLRTIGGDNYVNVLYLDGHASGFLKPPDDLEIITEKINPLKSHSTYSP